MEELKGEFWRDEAEMIEAIEELGYEVIDISENDLFVMDIDDRHSEFPTEIRYQLIRLENKITIKF